MATPQLARAHGHLSNRAKVRSALDRKPVFKSVLENPFQISWPSIPENVQNVLLARLVASLENVTRPFRKIPQKTDISYRENVDVDCATGTTQSEPQALDQGSSVSPHFIVGINAVTRALESQLRDTRKHVTIDNHQRRPLLLAPSPIWVVFVCYADIDPSALVAHIPYLVAGCNSPRSVTQPIKLVPLPKDSEATIAQILGVRRAAVVAFRYESPLNEAVQDVLGSVPIVSAPWLCPSDTQVTPRLVPTHIKQLRTTAPKDMKAAREQRSKGRAAARKNVSSSSQAMRRKPRMTLTTERAT